MRIETTRSANALRLEHAAGFHGSTTDLLDQLTPLVEQAAELGVEVFEGSPVTGLSTDGPTGPVELSTADGRVAARKVVLATNAFPALLPRYRLYTVPVYDYALMTEPLTAAQRDAVRWHHRQGLADSANQFHYFRITADHRILWGGYDAVHHFGGAVRAEYDQRPETHLKLARHFHRCFPQLADVRFTHRWGGAIDTTTRFTVTFGQTMGGRVTYALGYTGLGVGASRWAAGVVRDFILRPDEDRLRLRIVASPPVPIPPEPLRSVAVDLVRHELDRADRNEGRRGVILQTLDALGIGFDS